MNSEGTTDICRRLRAAGYLTVAELIEAQHTELDCANTRIEELEAENNRLLFQIAGLEGRNEALAEMNQHQASVIDRLRAGGCS